MRFWIFGQVINRVGSIADFGYTLDYELARDFCEVIVDEAEGWINYMYHLIEIESE